jgi:hypothetical protein
MSDLERQKELAWTCADYILEGEGRHWLEQFRKDLPKNYAIEEPDYGGHESGGDGIVWPYVKFKKSVAGHAYAALKVSFRHSRVGTLPAGVSEGSLQEIAFASIEKAGLTAGRVPLVFGHQVYSDKNWPVPLDFILMEKLPSNVKVRLSCRPAA